MTDLTALEVCIGSLGQQKMYLNWHDVKDICTYAVSAVYEQTERENTKLKELLKECRSPINYALCVNLSKEEKKEFKNLLAKINQALGEDK